MAAPPSFTFKQGVKLVEQYTRKREKELQRDQERRVKASEALDKEIRGRLYIDPATPMRSEPLVPPGESIDRNVAEAQKHAADPWYKKYPWFIGQVAAGRPWDYKLYPHSRFGSDIEHGRAGNYNFGRAGIAAGIPEQVLRRGAGAAQMLGGHWRPEFGYPWDKTGSFGDDPWDRLWVDQGIQEQKRRGR